MTTKTDAALEIEVKIRIDSVYLEELRINIAKKGYHLVESRTIEQNIIFDTPDRVLKRNKFLLRLRKKNNKYIITFKRPPISASTSGTYKIREETEVEVSDFETVKKIFMGLGYEVVFVYEKYRETFHRDNVELMVDETPIGNFLEIEGPEEAIDHAAAELGYGKSDYITDNYRTLFRKAGHSGNMVFGE